MDDKDNKTNKKKMSFNRFTNLLYEASSSLVPGTGELNSTKYTGDAEKQKAEGNQG